MKIDEITLLTKKQVNGLEIFRKYSGMTAITDFAILLGGVVTSVHTPEGDGFDSRCGIYWTRTSDTDGNVWIINSIGRVKHSFVDFRPAGIRVVKPISSIDNLKNVVRNEYGILEVEYGEYPQWAVKEKLSNLLEEAFKSDVLNKTGKVYTTDSKKWSDTKSAFNAQQHVEYEYESKKYVRVIANLFSGPSTLSNCRSIETGDIVWVEVQPIVWLVDEEAKLAVCKKTIASGVRLKKERGYWYGNFEKTEMNRFLQTYLKKDILPSKIREMTEEEKQIFEERQKELEKRRNPYGLNLNKASEEDIIRGAIESGVAVFLNGEPSEGKSARVKQIDPTCEIIYLRNASPESLNGKSVYNSSTGEMIDIKPSWLKRIEEKCEKEPDTYHIVFLDEITNALPSIQGIAFNIVLDREVNGIWKLPDNARIVAAGNEMKDSLAANQLAEPLFNRFAHVYIKTTTEAWLKWASENNIHPAIYAYVAYKKGEVLRSKYNGEKPNADPRKWEMASKMLYKTGQPEMLRALIGEDITKEFVQFCNQRVITLEDVLKGKVRDEDINELNTSERYATTFGLTQVSEEDVIKVREFIKRIDPEFVSMFDVLWTHNDESRLEIIADERKRVLNSPKLIRK